MEIPSHFVAAILVHVHERLSDPQLSVTKVIDDRLECSNTLSDERQVESAWGTQLPYSCL